MSTPDPKAFLGQGWAFPFQFDASGEIGLVAYEEDIRQAIRLILGTNQGERVMRPDFGAGLQALTFEPISATTKALVKHRVEQALITWEPRIDNLTINVRANPPLGRLDIELTYRVRATNIFYNLVYPFYLLEGKER
ncbi:MAG: GPW/gp25 family protein [Chloroflexi bacterium]|nr:GPW/gp25 family protein [Chloroflexota bacterium]MBP8054761.1 GPW/gp25 family protein [Chloroflexota bacterium]